MTAPLRKTSVSFSEAAIVSAICFGLFIFWSIEAVLAGFPEARFTDSSNVWLILLEVTLGAAALFYLYVRGFDIRSLYPRPGIHGTLLGLGVFFAAWIVGAIATAPFASPGHSSMVEFSFAEVSLASTVAAAIVNGAFEEIFLLGVLVRGLRRYGLSVAIGVSLLVRVLYHLYQGPLGAVWILAFGLTLTFFYVRSMQLWPPVLAHILWDIVPVFGFGG